MSGAIFPIRLVALHAENFRGLAGSHSLQLESQLTRIIGRNGTGKSSLLGAVEWCLFGSPITKKSGSGIAERAEWALAHHDASGHVSATLELQVEAGVAKLTRRRAAEAKAREEDELWLELPGDELLRAQEVQDWLTWNHLPDWSTWKRSFCQHQELSRERVTDSGARSDAIASMLGLDEFRQMNSDLKGLKVKRLEECATNELSALHEEQVRALERPTLELRDLEARLERAGISAAQAGEAEFEQRKRSCLTSAREIATRLQLTAQVPEVESSATEFIEWTRAWPGEVRRKLDSLGTERRALALQVETLESSAEALEPARRSEADARAACERLLSEFGATEDLSRQQAELEQRREALEDQRRVQDATGKLVRDALALVRTQAAAEQCPVCDQAHSQLEQVIQGKLDAGAPDALQADFESLEQRAAKLREQAGQVAQAEATLESSRTQVRTLEDRIRGQLPTGTSPDEAMNELLRTWRAEERALTGNAELAEKHLTTLRDETERLELLMKLQAARARANLSAGEVSQSAEFEALQRAIDEAAGFASDLEALSAMARGLEDEQSTQQITSVNASINSHYRTITNSDVEQSKIRIKVKKTASKVSYQLVDDQGRVVTSSLNQAAFNALSLAALFASAEVRAREGEPQFLLLDDPGQSLDPEHQAGLARSLIQCSQFTPVIVGTYPGALADELSKVMGTTYLLSRNDANDNTLIREA